MEDFDEAPESRYGHSSTLIEEKIIIFGGLTLKRDKYFNDINIFDMDAEAFLTNIIPNPKLKILGRHFHSTVFDSKNKHLLFFGGKSNGYLNDVVVFDVENENFLAPLNEKNMKGDIPSKRYGCSAVYFKENMFVFGGYNSSGFDCNDLFCFNIKKREWKRYLTKIPRRYLYGNLLIDENKWFIFHGLSKKLKSLFDVWQIEFSEKEKEVAFEISPVKVKKNVFEKKSKNYGQTFFFSDGKVFCYGRRDEKQSFFHAKLIKNKKEKVVEIEWKKNPFPFLDSSFFSYGSVSVDQSNSTLYFFGGLKITDEKELKKKLERKKKESKKKKKTSLRVLNDNICLRILSYLTRKDIVIIRAAWKKITLSVVAYDIYFWKMYYEKTKRSFSNAIFGFEMIEKKLKKVKNASKRIVVLNKLVKKEKEKSEKVMEEVYSSLKDTKLKVVVEGDGAVGKSCLLITYKNGQFPTDYVPSVFDNWEETIEWNHQTVKLTIWDTAGGFNQYERLRPLMYPETNVFILCFSLVNRNSIEYITNWVEEMAEWSKNTPMILVGTKKDLHSDVNIVRELAENERTVVSTEEGLQLAKDIKAYGYFECSAKHNQGVHEVFNGVIQAYVDFHVKENSQKKCLIM